MDLNKIEKLFRELKEVKKDKWKAENNLIKAGDKIRKLEQKIDKELK